MNGGTRITATNLRPQSSHSHTRFHPSLLPQRSHLDINRPLEKNSSKGFQLAGAAATPLSPGPGDPSLLCFAPGLRSVNLCTRGGTKLPYTEPIGEPPSVPRVLDMTDEPVRGAVW